MTHITPIHPGLVLRDELEEVFKKSFLTKTGEDLARKVIISKNEP